SVGQKALVSYGRIPLAPRIAPARISDRAGRGGFADSMSASNGIAGGRSHAESAASLESRLLSSHCSEHPPLIVLEPPQSPKTPVPCCGADTLRDGSVPNRRRSSYQAVRPFSKCCLRSPASPG